MTILEDPTLRDALLQHTADIVCAFVSHHGVSDVRSLIASVHEAVVKIASPQQAETAAAEVRTPAVPVDQSIADDYIVSLITGEKFKSLKRHLTAQGITAEDYRAQFGLPNDYPMVCPAYSRERSVLAKEMGLGQHRKKAPGPALAASSKPARKTSPKSPARAAA